MISPLLISEDDKLCCGSNQNTSELAVHPDTTKKEAR